MTRSMCTRRSNRRWEFPQANCNENSSWCRKISARTSIIAGPTPDVCSRSFGTSSFNAVKFSAVGGELRISTRNDGEHRIQVDLTDTGVGIALEQQPRVFEAFEQGGRSGQHGGLGLGLAVAKGIVEMHGGEISVHSAGRDQGTTFSITLQSMETSMLDGTAPLLAKPRPAATSLAILLAEDHADTAQLLQRLLQRAGHQVAHANSVASALAFAAGARFDLLITDIGLPDGTGVGLLEALRKTRDLPAIAISGFGMKADLDASRTAGFAEHFTKPLDWDRLQDAITRVIEQTRN